MTMTSDHGHDRFHGMLKFQPLAEAAIVIVTSHSPAVSGLIGKPNMLIYLLI